MHEQQRAAVPEQLLQRRQRGVDDVLQRGRPAPGGRRATWRAATGRRRARSRRRRHGGTAATDDVEHPEHVDGPEREDVGHAGEGGDGVDRGAGGLEQRAVALGPLVLHEQLVGRAGRRGRGTAARPAGWRRGWPTSWRRTGSTWRRGRSSTRKTWDRWARLGSPVAELVAITAGIVPSKQRPMTPARCVTAPPRCGGRRPGRASGRTSRRPPARAPRRRRGTRWAPTTGSMPTWALARQNASTWRCSSAMSPGRALLAADHHAALELDRPVVRDVGDEQRRPPRPTAALARAARASVPIEHAQPAPVERGEAGHPGRVGHVQLVGGAEDRRHRTAEELDQSARRSDRAPPARITRPYRPLAERALSVRRRSAPRP